METEEDIEEESSEKEGSRDLDLPSKATVFFAVSKNFDQHGKREVPIRGHRSGATVAADGWRYGNATPGGTDTRYIMTAA